VKQYVPPKYEKPPSDHRIPNTIKKKLIKRK
jgi:hypothetical protein